MLKKTLAATTVLASLVLALAACSSSGPSKPASHTNAPSSPPGGATSASAASQPASAAASGAGNKSIKLALLTLKKSDPFFITMACGAKAEAVKDGVSLAVQGTIDYGATNQIPVLNAIAATKPNAVIISPGDPNALYQPLKQEFHDHGEKVVLVNSTLANSDIVSAQVVSDNQAGGQDAASALLNLMGSKGAVLAISNTPGNPVTDARVNGFKAGLTGKSGVSYTGVQYGEDSTTKIATIVQGALARNKDLTGIFAADLTTAEAAASALSQAGKAGSVKLVTFDAGPQQVEDLQKGIIQALVAQQPYQMGAKGVDEAVAAVEGKPVTAMTTTGFTVITKSNLASNQSALYADKC